MSEVTKKNMEQGDVEKLLTTLPETHQKWLRDSRERFQALPSKPENTVTGWQVIRLGKPAEEKEKEKEKETKPAIADILAAVRKPFCVGFRGNSRGNAAYFLGVEKDSKGERTKSLLQAAFGMAEVAPLEEANLRFEEWGSCSRVYFSDDQLKQLPKPSEMTESWVDALACAAFNSDCQIRLDFCPLDSQWLEDELKEAYELLDKMTQYQESSLQISHSGGFSVNKNGHIIAKVGDTLGASEKKNRSDNTSVNVNLKQEHWAIKLACEELQFRIRELQQLKRDGGWSLRVCAQTHWSDDLQTVEQILGSVFVRMGYRCDWKPSSESCAMILSSSQLSQLVHHPSDTFPGLEMKQLHNFAANLPEPDGPQLKAGYLIWNHREIKAPQLIENYEQPMAEIPLKQLNRHAFICGKTGSGKTNSVCSLLSNLGDVPFMVIEPVKGEYRSLKSIMPELQLYNFEIHGKHQLHMNPFWFPKYGKLSYHIDSLKSIIAASFELEAAMPDILMQCLVSSYVKKGWNIATNQNIYAGKLPDEMLYPTFTSLCQEVEQYIKNAGFGEELESNYRGAMLSRLQSYTTGTIGPLLNCSAKPPVEDWIRNKTSCVIELDELADDSDKAVIMGTLLTQYFQCIKYGSEHQKQKLKHVIVLEEAHHLFKETGASKSSGKDNRQHLVELLSNMLAEIRAYGEGIFIVDQSPTSVSTQVIKNTAVKMVHYTDFKEDLEVLQDSLLLDSADQNAPASLECGHALLRFGSMIRPVHLRMPLCHTKENMGIRREKVLASDDAQNLLDIVRMNRISSEGLRKKCWMFVNSFLFETQEKRDEALQKLIGHVETEAVRLGYDWQTLSGISPEGKEYILRSLIAEALPVKYPNQFLLSARIQMAIDRYLHLIRLQPKGLSPKEELLIQQYLEYEVLPALIFYYKHSNNEKLNRVVKAIPPSQGRSIVYSDILSNMVVRLEEKVQMEQNKGQKLDIEKIFNHQAASMMDIMRNDSFLTVLSPELSQILWEGLRTCWNDLYPSQKSQ